MGMMQKVIRKLQKRGSKVSRSSSLSTSSRCSSSWDFSDWNDLSESDGDGESCTSGDAPVDVPEGYLAVYVGEQRTRCVMNAQHLNHPWFRSLLEKSAEEFGFHHKEGLVLLCELVTFEKMIQKLERISEINPEKEKKTQQLSTTEFNPAY